MTSEFNPVEYVTVPQGWSCKRLADCTKDGNISYGIVQPGQHDENGIPVVRVNNVNNGQLDLNDVLKVSPDVEKKYQRTRLEGGEVLLTLVGSTGQSFVAPNELSGWNVPRAIAVIRADEKIGADWINICLQSKEVMHFLNVRANTTVQKTLNLKDVRDIPIIIPPKEVKEYIEGIALSLSNKIELNRQTNQTLEQIAQAIFKSWFVDFEPTRAKIIAKEQGANLATQELAAQAIICGAITLEQLEELEQSLETTLQQAIGEKLNQHNQTNPAALNAQQLKTTAALFPNELAESELGDVPVGWETKPLYETAEYINGAAFKATDFSEDGSGLPIVKIAELKNGLGENTKYTTGNFNKRHFIQDEDVLYSWSGSPLTSLEVFKWFGGDGWLNQHIFKLNFNRVEEKYFTYYLLQHMKPVLIATAQQKQTTGLGHITVADMKRLLVAYPEDRVLSGFSEVIGSLYEKCSSLSKENISLTQLRDALLPKLLSGELAVADSPTQAIKDVETFNV